MTQARLFAPALALAAAGLFAGLLTGPALRTADAQSDGDATTVGVVDLERVLKDSKQFKVLNESAAATASQNQEALAARQKQVESLKTALDALDATSEAAIDKQIELAELTEGTKAWATLKGRLGVRQQTLNFINVHKNAVAAIEAVAADTGVDLVITKGQANLNPNAIPADATQQAIAGLVLADSKVVFQKDAVDLTERVITRMNADFEANP